MVNSAKRHREFITDFKTQALGLRVAHVMRVRGRAPADEARLTCDKAEMLLAADPRQLTEGQSALVELWGEQLSSMTSI